MVWLQAQPLALHRRYLLKHASHVAPARVRSIRHRIDMETLDPQATTTLELNGIGVIEVETDRPILADLYGQSRTTGSFILIDPASNATVGAGMIRQVLAAAVDADQPPRIVLAGHELVEQLEQRLLDLDYSVVRTRVQEHSVWRALHEARVIVLVETDEPVQILSKEFIPEPVADASVDALLAALDVPSAKETS